MAQPDEPTGLGWSLLALAWAAPWLVGIHGQPWTSFYNDWLAAFGVVPLAIWVAWRQRGHHWALDRLACGTLLLAVVPLLQGATGLLLFASDGVLVALHLAALAATAAVARRAEERAPDRAGDTLFAGLLCAALLSTGLALYQRFDLTYLGMLVEPLPNSNRPIANVGQPNLLATLLNWGLLALWWAFDRRRIGAFTAVFAACFLLIGVAVTQSRTGIVCALGLAAAAIAWRRLEGRGPSGGVVGALVGLLLLLVALWPLTAQDLMLDKALTLSDQAAIGRRPQIWQLCVEAIRFQPWFGYGWNQGAVAQQAVALQHAPLHLVVTHAHNLVLDLLTWNGALIGTLSIVALLGWFVLRAGGLRRQRDAVLWLMSTVLLVHAMVELPHAHLMFLTPAAISMGLLNQRLGVVQVVRVRDGLVRVVLLGLVAGALVVFADYRRVETDLMALRMRTARIGDLTATPPPQVWALEPLGAVLRALRTEPAGIMRVGQLDEMSRAAMRYPSAPLLFEYAKAAALHGDTSNAERALGLLCSLHTLLICQQAVSAWNAQAETAPLLKAVRLPSTSP
ncbi:MAG TPA: Wzy polymerase domain-containing protein [Burkholderiaceae bacterium]|nr:Wzy polymerase domain-containing protein [Burkholderiaceae bacterium]